MDILHKLVRDIPIPAMMRVRQRFDSARLDNPMNVLAQQLRHAGSCDRIQPGQQVAIAVGSRGIANIADAVKETVSAVKEAGGIPFLVPSMGSHGGATAEGQKEVLEHLGIRASTVGAEIRTSMEVVEIARMDNGLPVYVDQHAYEADAIIVINRIKPHTAFRGPIESGLMKMIAIGLGKQKGAEACHQLGFQFMADNVQKMAGLMLDRLPILFGVALVENAYDQTCHVEVVAAENIQKREPELLKLAKDRMPRIGFDSLDVLVIDYIGKNISGDGMDPNITGRYPTPYAHGGPEVGKMVVLDLTDESKGNANGIGTADFASQRLVDKMDRAATYANGLTSTVCAPTKIATTLNNDRDTIRAAIKTCNILDYSKCRLVRLRDTLHLSEIEISVNLLDEARQHPDIEVLSDPYSWQFNEKGNLFE